MAKKSDYILGNVIARGGMAEIFLGKAIGEGAFHRLCAIKRILPHYANDKEFVKMFKDEASICQGLHHANIVQVYDFKKIENSYALVMEYVEGADLRTTLSSCEKHDTRLNIPMIVYIIAEAARGLHYAHTKLDEETHQPLGIIHRDISPQNILISFEGEVKITDFGIADSDHRETETKPGVVKGKYSYMSPEQVNAKKLDARTDVFSLAVILWEALAMRRLFAGQNEVETIKRVQTAEVRYNLQELNDKVDDKLMKIINKGLQADRKRRFQSAKEFEKELLKYLHSYFPDFNSAELSSFMKNLFMDRRDKVKQDIKELLTKTVPKQEPSGIQESSTDENKSALVSEDLSSQSLGLRRDEENNLEIDLSTESDDGVVPISLTMNPVSMTRGPQFTRGPGSTKVGGRDNETYGSRLQYRMRSDTGRIGKSRGLQVSPVLLISLIVVLGVLGLVIKDMKSDSSSKAPTLLELDGPQSVQLVLNGKLVDNGRYLRLPYRLKIGVGEHQLKVMRQGFQSKVYGIKIKQPGDVLKKNLLLVRDPSALSSPVKISLRGAERVIVDIDRGFLTTELTQLSPIFIKQDLTYGVEHQILIKKNDSRKAYVCRFSPKSTNTLDPFHILIQPNADGFACKILAR